MFSRTILSKQDKKERAGKLANNLGYAGAVAAFSIPTVGLAIFVPAAALSVYSGLPSREERVMRILDEGNRSLVRLTKKSQKNIHSDITADEILEIAKEGLVSGKFCERFPHLYSPSEVKDHIEQVLESKYAVHQ